MPYVPQISPSSGVSSLTTFWFSVLSYLARFTHHVSIILHLISDLSNANILVPSQTCLIPRMCSSPALVSPPHLHVQQHILDLPTLVPVCPPSISFPFPHLLPPAFSQFLVLDEVLILSRPSFLYSCSRMLIGIFFPFLLLKYIECVLDVSVAFPRSLYVCYKMLNIQEYIQPKNFALKLVPTH